MILMRFQRLKHMRRYREVINILAHHGFGFVLDQLGLIKHAVKESGDYYRFSAPERVRMALEELGATFVKLGQLLSLRPDLIPRSVIVELEKLQDMVPPFPADQVKKMLEEEGIVVAEVFREFNFEPIASASIGQVHRAELLNGRKVAVKVQRPEVAEVVKTDLDILFDLARLAEKRTRWGRFYQVVDIVIEFSEAIRAEIDFAQEGRNATRFHEEFVGNPKVLVPQIIWDLSGRRVLVMDYLEGIKVSDLEALQASGANLRKVVANIVDSFYTQVYVNGFFHADPHPGNLAVGPGDKIIYYDFGQMGNIDHFLKERSMDMVLSMVRYDVDGVTRALLDLGMATKHVNREELRRDITKLQRKYYGVPLSSIDVGGALIELMQLSVRHQVRVPPELSLIVKMLMTVESVVVLLDPDLSMVEVTEPYRRMILRERYNPRRLKDNIRDLVLEYASIVRNIPREFETILSLVGEGELRLKVQNPDTKKIISRVEVMINRISVSIVIASLVIGTSLLADQMPRNLLLRIPLAEVGFILAAILGLILVYSIIRSGRI